MGIAHPKDDFVFRIILLAMAAKAFVDFGIYTFQRLENRDRRQRLCAGDLARFSLAQKNYRAPKAKQVVEHTGNDTNDRYELDYREDQVHHGRAQGSLLVTQRLDWIQVRRLPRGVDAEDQSNASGRREAEDRP